MDVYAQIAVRIIKQQESVIGPVAIEQANAVSGLKVDWDKKEANVSGDGAKVIDRLVEQYKKLFGQISVEVCKEAAGPLMSKLPAGKQPKELE